MMNNTDQKDIRKKQIIFLVETYYDKFEILHSDDLDSLKNLALDAFLDSSLTIDEINNKLMEIVLKRSQMNKDKAKKNRDISKNHETVYFYIEKLADSFNKEGIDYQLAGSLSGYLMYNTESTRSHDDIDFHLNERDIERAKKIVTEMGFVFSDRRINSPKILKDGTPIGEHEVMATLNGSDFHIGFFCFERLENGFLVSKNYYHDENYNACAREEIFGPKLTKEIFDNNVTFLNNTQVKVTAPEFVFQLKHYTNNEKDKSDIEFLSEHINLEKLQRIRDLSKSEKHIQVVPVTNLPRTTLLNPLAVENDNSELSQMLVATEIEGNNLVTSLNKGDKSKALVKSNENKNSNNDGYADYIMIAITFFSLMMIGLITILFINL